MSKGISDKLQLLIISTSTVHGKKYLEYITDNVKNFFNKTDEVLFIPYARPSGISYADYLKKAAVVFLEIGINLRGIHEFEDAQVAVENCNGIFTGGGNSFVLLNTIYQNKLIEPLQKKILEGTPYMGTSAGCNIIGLTIGTTNDMPIVYPPSFDALQLVPFNINPHFLDPDPNSRHMGETRETRIFEFHQFNTQPVIGLREGSWIEIKNKNAKLKGTLHARLFRVNQEPKELPPESDLQFLWNIE